MKRIRLLILSISLAVAFPGFSQTTSNVLSKNNLEVSGGWVHMTGDNGLDGFDVGAALWFTPRVSVAFNYDHAGDTSVIGAFALTSSGLVTIKSNMQNWLVGPRVFFPSKRIKRFDIDPFAEFQIGGTHLNQKLTQVGVVSQSASDNAYSWMIGGGADYVLSPHWAARANLDILRTHLVETGQTRLRMVLGVNYTFRRRR
jgi:hypothetical protein